MSSAELAERIPRLDVNAVSDQGWDDLFGDMNLIEHFPVRVIASARTILFAGVMWHSDVARAELRCRPHRLALLFSRIGQGCAERRPGTQSVK